MSDTILKHDDLTPAQEYSIAGGVILLFGLLYWIFNYGMPDFGTYSGAVPAPVVLDADATARPARLAWNDVPAPAADTSAETTPVTTQSTAATKATVDQQQQIPVAADSVADTGDQQLQAVATDGSVESMADAGDQQLQAVVTDGSVEADQAVIESEGKPAAAVSTEQQAVAVNNAADNGQQAEQTAESATDATDNAQQQQVQATQVVEQENQTEPAATSGVVIMDAAVAKLQDHLVKGEMEQPVIMESIQFASGSSEIDMKSDHQIEGIAGLLQRHPDVRLLIRGHTDAAGPDNENKELSLMRARAMGQKLVEAGVNSENIIIMGMGSAESLSGNNTQQGRGKDRRIDVSITQ